MINNPNHSYRSDIDGLRAIAILSVLFFHAFPKTLQGGFVGVDIFFVISGFLITNIIIRDIFNKTFSFKNFYFKRIKRIFPSLIIVLYSCLIFGWLFLTDFEYKQLGVHIFSGSLFSSNFQLWSEVGYFDNSSITKPLLHLWSLSIEEQFYILWPLILVYFWKRKFNFLTLSFLLLSASFYLNLLYINKFPEFVFYFPLTRFWEIIFGGILAKILNDINHDKFLILKRKFVVLDEFLEKLFFTEASSVPRSTFLNLISIIGISFIFYSIFFFNSKIKFPGLYALIPVLGTGLIIAAGQKTFINRIIANKFFVFIGLISYSLYLWHWPIISFIKIIQGSNPDYTYILFGVSLSIVLAIISTFFIENPIRKIQNYIVMHVLICLMLFGGLLGYYIFYNNGFKEREAASNKLFNDVLGHKEFFEYSKKNFYPCSPQKIYDAAEKWEDITRCFQSKQSDDIDVLLYGDSHAESLFIGIAEAMPDQNVAYYYQQGFLDHLRSVENNHVYQEVLKNKKIKLLLINGYYIGLPILKDSFIKTVNNIQKSGKNLYILDDIPLFPFDASKCLYNRRFSNIKPVCDFQRDDFDLYYNSYIHILEDIVKKNNNIKLIKVADTFCNKKVCSMKKDDKLLYRDDNHLSVYGSQVLGKRIVELLKK